MTSTSSQIFPETSPAKLDILLINVGSASTFRGRRLGSIVDLTYPSTLLAEKMVRWVKEHCTHDNHQASFSISKTKETTTECVMEVEN